MVRILSVLLTCFLITTVFGKGGSGIYYISGIAYGKEDSVLSNTKLNISFGKENSSVLTGPQGEFEIEVHWHTACPSKITRTEWRRCTDQMNPEFLNVSHDKKELKIKNEWEKYAGFGGGEKEKRTKKTDLHF